MCTFYCQTFLLLGQCASVQGTVTALSMQDTVVNMVHNGGAGPLLCHKGPRPTRAERLESAGTNWNWLEPAGHSPYTFRCSLWSVDFSLGQLLDSHISPLGQLLVSLIFTLGQLLVTHLPIGTFWISRLPIGTTLGLSHLLLCIEIGHWQPYNPAVLIKPNSGLIFVSNTDTEP